MLKFKISQQGLQPFKWNELYATINTFTTHWEWDWSERKSLAVFLYNLFWKMAVWILRSNILKFQANQQNLSWNKMSVVSWFLSWPSPSLSLYPTNSVYYLSIKQKIHPRIYNVEPVRCGVCSWNIRLQCRVTLHFSSIAS